MHPEARALKHRYEQAAKFFELPEDVEPFGEQRARRIAGINQRRATHGLPPLENNEVGHPELTERRRRRAKEFWGQRDAERRSDL